MFFRSYQIKWYFILTGILCISSIMLRPGNLSDIRFWEFLNFLLRICSSILVCWLIHSYFYLHKLKALNNYANHFLSNILGTLAAVSLIYLQHAVLPTTKFIEPNSPSYDLHNFFFHLTHAFLVSIICYAVSYSVHTNAALQTSKLENEILEQAHLRAQLLSLQQQISPHFLFNSLSTLKTIATDQPTKNYVMQLATVYRYVLNFNEHYLTPLKDELAFIKSYLYIMNERFEETLQVHIEVPKEHLDFRIPSLSLQLLIENAIKHNMISPEQPLTISLITDSAPSLTVVNNYQPKKVSEEGTGTGLKNISERYKLLVNKSIQISADDGKFSVTLPLLEK